MNGNGVSYGDLNIEQGMSQLNISDQQHRQGQQPVEKTEAQPEDLFAKFRIFVGGISWKATEHDLAQLFQQFGTVVESKIIYDKVTRKSKGYGFVTFDNEQSADNAIQAKQANPMAIALFGKAMDVGPAVRRNSPVEDPNAPKQPPPAPPPQRSGQAAARAARAAAQAARYQNFHGGYGRPRGGYQAMNGYAEGPAYGRMMGGYGQPPVAYAARPDQIGGYGSNIQGRYWGKPATRQPAYQAAPYGYAAPIPDEIAQGYHAAAVAATIPQPYVTNAYYANEGGI